MTLCTPKTKDETCISYIPLINFRAMILAILGHVYQITGQVSGNTPRPVDIRPAIFQWSGKDDKVNKVSRFSVFIFLIISNGSSEGKLVLYNPVSLKFLAFRS